MKIAKEVRTKERKSCIAGPESKAEERGGKERL